MRYKIKGVLSFKNAIKAPDQFIDRFIELLDEFNIDFDGSLDPIKKAGEDPENRRGLN